MTARERVRLSLASALVAGTVVSIAAISPATEMNCAGGYSTGACIENTGDTCSADHDILRCLANGQWYCTTECGA